MRGWIQKLLPRSPMWGSAARTTLSDLFLGIEDAADDAIAKSNEVLLEFWPDTVSDPHEFLERNGVGRAYSRGLSEEEARALARVIWREASGTSPAQLHEILHSVWPELLVHDWWESEDPYVARTPSDYAPTIRVGSTRCGVTSARCGVSSATCDSFILNESGYLTHETLRNREATGDPDASPEGVFYVADADLVTGVVLDTHRDVLRHLVLRYQRASLQALMLVDYTPRGDALVTYFRGDNGQSFDPERYSTFRDPANYLDEFTLASALSDNVRRTKVGPRPAPEFVKSDLSSYESPISLTDARFLHDGSEFTITARVYAYSWSPGSHVIIHSTTSASSQPGIVLRVQNSQLQFRIGPWDFPNNQGASLLGGDLDVNTWYTIQATFDGDDVKLYVDGAEVDSWPDFDNPSTEDPQNRLTVSQGNASFDGVIGDVMVSDEALSSDDLAAQRLFVQGRWSAHPDLDETLLLTQGGQALLTQGGEPLITE